MAVGDIGIWVDTNGVTSPTSFTKFPFEGTGSENRNDGGYTYNSSTDDITLDDSGNYLVLYHILQSSTSSARGSGAAYLAINGTKVEATQSSGYRRNASNSSCSIRGYGILNIASGDEVSVYHRMFTSVGGDSAANTSSIMIVRLADSSDAAYSHYEFTSGQALGGTSYSDVTITSNIRETDTSVIERTGDNIRLKPSGTIFLICYAINNETGGNRTQRIGRAVTGSTHVPGSNSYAYCRDTSNPHCTPNAMFLHKTTSANEDISIQCRTESAPGWTTSDDGSFSTTTDSGVFVVELPSTAEAFISYDGTAGQALDGGVTATIDAMRNESEENTSSFSSSSNNDVDIQKDMDVLLMASVNATRDTSGSTRLHGYGSLRINTVDQALARDYGILRGDASSQDCPDGNWNPALITSVSSADTIDLQIVDAGDNGVDDNTNANEVGFSALNLDTIATAAATTTLHQTTSYQGMKRLTGGMR